jgi:hypothetical protein
VATLPGGERMASRHPARRTGVIVVVLLVASVALALYLAHHYHLGVPQTLVAVLVGGGAPAGLYLAWATYRDSRSDAGDGENLSLTAVADQLARLVGKQWEDEAKVRHLDEPSPLPVSWVAAGLSMADAWDVLVALATSGHGWPAPPPGGTWAAGPDGLAGSGRDLLKVLERVPTGRLVVLGEPGAGKTMHMVGLILDVLADRASGDPVPVLVSLASWNPEEQDLPIWMASQLTIDYPALSAPASSGEGESTRIDALLAAGLIFPILDGLDEIPEKIRAQAIIKINNALRPGRRLVVACRTEQYCEAIDIGASVQAAAVVQLCPLDAGSVSAYLSAVGGPGTAKRWAPVLATLGTQSPVGEALTRPLMVGLARTIYSPKPGELAGQLRDPKELCDLADRDAVESHLFDAFIPAAYNSGKPCRWTAQEAESWLVFLARHLRYEIKSPDYAWWELKRTLRSFKDVNPDPSSGIRFGVSEAVSTILGSFLYSLIPLTINILFVLFVDVIGSAMGHKHDIRKDLISYSKIFALSYLAIFAIVGLWTGLKSVPSNLALAASPRGVLTRDRRAALTVWLAFALGFGLIAEAVTILKFTHGSSWAWVAGGFATGFAFGVAVSGINMAWPLYTLDRGRLALRHRLPWSLMRFLEDAHHRGVLRQAGAIYQFRHIELQNRLATRVADTGSPVGQSDPL